MDLKYLSEIKKHDPFILHYNYPLWIANSKVFSIIWYVWIQHFGPWRIIWNACSTISTYLSQSHIML